MNRTLCCCSPAYGAMMHALPRDASALKRMTEQQIFDQASPWVNRVPPQTEVALHAWAAKAISPTAKGLGDLGDLSELAGIGKKLKKVAKKIAKAPIKLVKAQVKIVKKAAKSSIVKKLARPLAYAVGAATGTIGVVAKADQIRTAARKAKAKMKTQAQEYGLTTEEQPAPEQPAAPEPVYQDQAPTVQPQYTQSAPAPQYQAPQQSFAPVQPQNAPPAPRQTFAPAPVQYEQPQYQAPQQTFAPAAVDPFANFNNVQRLAPADDEQEEKPKIVGLSTAGIMQSIKANPIPWTVGGLGLGFILYRAMNPSQRQRAY